MKTDAWTTNKFSSVRFWILCAYQKIAAEGGRGGSCRAYRDCIACPWLCPCEVLRFLEVKGLVPPRKPSGSHLSSKQFDAATQRWPWYVLLQKLSNWWLPRVITRNANDDLIFGYGLLQNFQVFNVIRDNSPREDIHTACDGRDLDHLSTKHLLWPLTSKKWKCVWLPMKETIPNR